MNISIPGVDWLYCKKLLAIYVAAIGHMISHCRSMDHMTKVQDHMIGLKMT